MIVFHGSLGTLADLNNNFKNFAFFNIIKLKTELVQTPIDRYYLTVCLTIWVQKLFDPTSRPVIEVFKNIITYLRIESTL